MTDCIFCRIIAGEASAYVVAEDDRTVAFLDRGQAMEGHTLVVPRTHASDIWTISEEEVAAVMVMAKRVAHLWISNSLQTASTWRKRTGPRRGRTSSTSIYVCHPTVVGRRP